MLKDTRRDIFLRQREVSFICPKKRPRCHNGSVKTVNRPLLTQNMYKRAQLTFLCTCMNSENFFEKISHMVKEKLLCKGIDCEPKTTVRQKMLFFCLWQFDVNQLAAMVTCLFGKGASVNTNAVPMGTGSCLQ